jgi:hypothetical protein
VETVRIKEVGCRRVPDFIWKCISQNSMGGLFKILPGKHKSEFCNSFKNKKIIFFVVILCGYLYYMRGEG